MKAIEILKKFKMKNILSKQINFYVFLLMLSVQTIYAQISYPNTKEIPVVDNYFGTKITDNFRWIENLSDTTVQNWIKNQANFSNELIGKLSGKEILVKRLKEYQQMSGDVFGKIEQNGTLIIMQKLRKQKV